MSNVLNGLGSLAEGISRGLVLNKQLKLQDMQLQRQKKADDEAAAAEADMRAADDAARRAYKELQDKHNQQYRGADAGMKYGGSDGSLTDAGVARLEQPVPAFRPDPNQLLRVAEVRTDELMKRGRYDQARKLWEQDEAMRRQLREDALRKNYRAFKAGGDPTPLIKGVYDNVDDNWDLGEVIPGPETHGGDRIFGVTRVNRVTGEKRTDELRESELEKELMRAMDPKLAAEYAWREKETDYRANKDRETAKFKHGLTLAEINARGEAAQSLQDSKNEGAYEIQLLRNDGARENAKIRVQGSISLAQLRGGSGGSSSGRGGGGSAASEYYAPRESADGTMVAVHKQTGIGKVVTDEQGRPMIGLGQQRLLASMTRDVGKTLEGGMKTYSQQRDTAQQVLPKPPAPRPGLDGFVRQPAPAQKPAAKPPIDSFFQR